MDTARKIAQKGCSDLTTVVASCQSKGRGRLQRDWDSKAGGLYFTVILKPLIPATLAYKAAFCAGLSMVCTLKQEFGIQAMLKWPNDILVQGQKICGLLAESESAGDDIRYINIGMGLNVNNTPSPELSAISLKKILGYEVDIKLILAKFLAELNIRMQLPFFDNVICEWKKYCSTINRFVRIETSIATIEGLAKDVDHNGGLVLERKDGVMQTIVYGDCFYQNIT